MDRSYSFFAVDLEATGGRTILGTISGGKVALEELTRFPNNLVETGGLYERVLQYRTGLRRAS